MTSSGAVDKAVDEGDHLVPFPERFIGGEDKGAVLISPGDDLEEEVGIAGALLIYFDPSTTSLTDYYRFRSRTFCVVHRIPAGFDPHQRKRSFKVW